MTAATPFRAKRFGVPPAGSPRAPSKTDWRAPSTGTGTIPNGRHGSVRASISRITATTTKRAPRPGSPVCKRAVRTVVERNGLRMFRYFGKQAHAGRVELRSESRALIGPELAVAEVVGL